ncbi:MAG: bifunctional phosphoglucose/phosphomannose isomerase [Dehalococcoidales bacterium]|nr:bifunctional phosphoglucose/phosphomannose isomerase [Dehalococcoidales bacterium]
MLKCIDEMPQLCQQAWQMVMDFDMPPDYSRVNKVVIFGVGGSAIGGDLVSSLTVSEAKIPIIIYRGYNLPAFIDAQTLVIASSCSGMTEETLSPFRKTLETESKKLAITTGGKLKEMAEARNIPVFSFDYRAQPRAALAFSLLPILGFLSKLGCISDKSAEVAEAVEVLQKMVREAGEGVSVSNNPAKQLAEKLYGRLAVVYGAGIVVEVAHRWKTQLNENSKAWAFYEVFPELNHNSIVGYQFPPELAGKTMVVLLHSDLLPYRLKLRYQVTCELLDKAKVGYQVLEGDGTSPLSHIMSLVLFGDYVSFYLAMLNKIDPTPVKNIAYLKEKLAKDKRE